MNYVRLKEICNINMGQSPNSTSYNYENRGIPFFQGNADFGEKYPSIRLWCDKPIKIASINDILISVRAPIGDLNYANTICCIGRGLASITLNKNDYIKEYIFYLLKSKKTELNYLGTGSTFKAISKKNLENIEVPIISIDKQYIIVSKIEKISKIITKKKYQLELLDDLVKARFVEMFGSIYDNKFGYNVRTLQDVCEPIKDGTHQTPAYIDDSINGFKFLSSKDVTTGKIDWNHLKYIPEELHNKLYKRISPRKGDILLAKNGTTGVAAIVDKDEVFDIYVSLALLRPLDIVASEYLCSAINSTETKKQFDGSLKGIGVPNLHLGEIKKTQIIVPPMELQEQFADFVKQVDKSKFLSNHSQFLLKSITF